MSFHLSIRKSPKRSPCRNEWDQQAAYATVSQDHVNTSGEAPLWVREKWVGLALPLARQEDSPGAFLTSGVLSGPKTFFSQLLALLSGRLTREAGYAVETHRAMAALAVASPEALTWWQENVPYVEQSNRYFVFQAHVGHVEECGLVA